MSGNFQGLAGFYGFHVFSGVRSCRACVIKIITSSKVSHPSAEVLSPAYGADIKTHIAVASPGDGAASELFQTMHTFHFTFCYSAGGRNGSTIDTFRFLFDYDYA